MEVAHFTCGVTMRQAQSSICYLRSAIALGRYGVDKLYGWATEQRPARAASCPIEAIDINARNRTQTSRLARCPNAAHMALTRRSARDRPRTGGRKRKSKRRETG